MPSDSAFGRSGAVELRGGAGNRRGRAIGCELPGVVKDDADSVTLAGAYPADAVAQIHAINASGALDGAAVDCEYDSIALL